MSRAAAVFACPYCGDDNLFPHEAEDPKVRAAWECRSCMRAFAVSFLGQLRRGAASPHPSPDSRSPEGRSAEGGAQA